MSEKEFDEKVKHALQLYTEDITSEKDRIKQSLDRVLFGEEETKQPIQKQKKKRPFVTLVSSVAACVMVFAGLQTEAGYAMMEKMKQWFAPEKEITLELEGTKEESHVTLHENASQYVIYIDEERYKITQNEAGHDVITAKEPLGSQYPEVSMEINQQTNTSKDALIQKLEKELTESGFVLRASEPVTTPQVGYEIRGLGSENTNWDTPVKKFFILEGKDGTFFVFKQQYFLEAAEGHGARFDAIIKEFYIKNNG